MNVFLDTEFTNLKGCPEAGLISIALVTEDLDRSFYAELTNTWDEFECSMFVVAEVLPHLDASPLPEILDYHQVNARMTMDECRLHLMEWLKQLADDKIVVWTDAPFFDWPFFKLIFRDHPWPVGVKESANAVMARNDMQRRRYENVLAQEQRRDGFKLHHALYDARAICTAWKSMLRKGIGGYAGSSHIIRTVTNETDE